MNKKYGRLVGNIAGSVLARGANVIATAITIPMTLAALGRDDYAIYAAMASFSLFFAFSDLGIGLSVVNPVASAGKRADAVQAARFAISQAWMIQLMIGAAVAVGGSLIAILVQYYGFHRALDSQATLSWAAMLVSVGLGIATGLSQRVLFGLGRNLEANLWLIGGRALSVGAIYLAALAKSGLFLFILAAQITPALVAVATMVALFVFSRPDLAPSLKLFDKESAFRQVATGLMFLILNFSVFCELGADNAILALVKGSGSVAAYDITSKPFFYICSLSGIVLFPIWPFIAQEVAAGQAISQRHIGFAFLFLSLAIALIGGVIALNIDLIIKLWVGQGIALGPSVVFPMAVNTVFVSIGMLQSMILNAQGRIKEQVAVQIVFILALLPWKLFLTWVAGPFGIVLALTSTYVPRLLYVHFRLIRGSFRPAV